MEGREIPGWVQVLTVLVSMAAGFWGLWCVVIGFTGGTMPIIGIETDGGWMIGLLMLFFGEPILMTLAYWGSMLVLAPIAMIFSRRSS